MDYGIKPKPSDMLQPWWIETLGDAATLMSRAKSCGAAFVEFVYEESMSPGELATLGAQAIDAGLGCSVHPYLFGDMAAEVFDSARAEAHEPMLQAVGELSRRSPEPVTLVYHGGLADCGPHDVPLPEATAAAKRFFAWIDTRVAEEWPNVRVFCETQIPVEPDETSHRVGDTYETCVDLVAGTGVGLCWDFGHTLAAHRLGKHAAFPPAECIAAVRHVHAHDTADVEGRPRDHQLLGTGYAPWRENFRLLAEVGFDGRVLLEVGLWTRDGYDGLKRMLDYAAAEIDPIFSATPRRSRR